MNILKSISGGSVEQLLIRLSGFLFAMVYLHGVGIALSMTHPLGIVAIGYLVVLLIDLFWHKLNSQSVWTRKSMNITADVLLISYCVYLSGAAGIPLLMLDLWIIIEHGLNQERRYFFVALGLAVSAFLFVLIVSPAWENNTNLGLCLTLSIIFVSLQLYTSLRKAVNAMSQAETRIKVKSDFVAGVCHEVRTPLNGIVNTVSLLQNTPLNLKQKELIVNLGVASETLSAIVNDLLDSTRLEAGTFRLEEAHLDLQNLLENLSKLFSAHLENKSIRLTVNLAPNIPQQLMGDGLRLQQILLNLIGNSIKFTDKGGNIEIYVNQTYKDSHCAKLMFMVVDNGIGIADGAQQFIFNRYAQADTSIARNYGGSGLGLSITKQLVELMNGQIGFTSKLGVGTTFWFEIPFALQTIPECSGNQQELKQRRVYLFSTRKFRKELNDRCLNYLNSWGVYAESVHHEKRLIEKISADVRNNYCPIVITDHSEFSLEEALKFVTKLYADFSNSALRVVMAAAPNVTVIDQIALIQRGYSAIISSEVDKSQLYNAVHASTSAVNHVTNIAHLVSVASPARKNSDRKIKILAGEDNPINQKVLQGLLSQSYYELTLVADGKAVLEEALGHAYDLVIIDMHMPIMDGLETAKALRASYPSSCILPIILLSGDNNAELEHRALSMNVNCFLTKPVEPLKLYNLIDLLFQQTIEVQAVQKEPVEIRSNVITVKEQFIFDTKELDEIILIGKSKDFANKLVDGFIRDSQAMINDLLLALAEQDLFAIERYSISFSDSARSLGAHSLANCCLTISRLAQESNYHAVMQMFSTLVGTNEQTKKFLLNYINHSGSAVSS